MPRKKRCKRSKHEKRHNSKSRPITKFKIGPITRNPFLNFLRDMRKAARSGMTITELTARGGELWRKMSSKQKKPYCELARQAAKVKRRKRRPRRRASERSFSTDSSVYQSRSRSSSCYSRR